MITCTLTYEIDPNQVAAFEAYAKVWIGLVNQMGGTHHGYWLPSEGANDVAYAMFSYPSLAAYEAYRAASMQDEECQKAFAFAQKTGCIRRYDRTFTRPVLDAAPVEALDAF